MQAGQTSPCYDWDFYPYGREVPHGSEMPPFVNTCPQNYKFTGKERDETGLDNFGARYNSSQYGRFMSPDSLQPTLWFAKTLSDSDFNRIQGCRPQAKCDSTLGWSTPFGYS